MSTSEGTWVGSGVNTLEYEELLYCEGCDTESLIGYSLEGLTGEISWDCPECKKKNTNDIDHEDGGEDPDYFRDESNSEY